jgi:outer membrane protein OmpA-like peptidoglycan-associated protein
VQLAFDFQAVSAKVFSTKASRLKASGLDGSGSGASGSKSVIRKRTKKVTKETPPLPVSVVNQTNPQAEVLNEIAKGIVEMQKAIKAFLEKEEGYLMKSVYGFDLDKTVILPSMIPNLTNNLEVMRKYPNIKVLLIGHTDDYATHEYNIDLGLRRAQVIRNWLVVNGIDIERISISTKGKTQPAIPNVNDSNRRYNRRVIFEEVKEEKEEN